MEKYITKLLIGTISKSELIALKNWLRDTKNQTILESYVREYHDLNLATIKNNIDAAYERVIHTIGKNEKPVKKLFPTWTRYAAVIVLLFGLGFFYQQVFLSKAESMLIPNSESITLELNDGLIQTVDDTQIKEVLDTEGNVIGFQQNNAINYIQDTQLADLVFNTINIPKGKRFELKLSDGSKVYLNSGSSLRFPVSFLKQGPREVFLNGEAYFDVAKNESNPFIVKTDDLDMVVLGTEFNVSAYGEDTNIDVVLVEGAVSLEKNNAPKDSSIILSPGQKATLDIDSKNLELEQVNTSLYTSWIQGHLVFRNQRFKNILKKLERHYNIEIINTNAELGEEFFNASFDNLQIQEVLEYFNDIHKIEYTINNNIVFVK